MQPSCASLLLLALVGIVAAQDDFWYVSHDGANRVQILTAADFAQTVAANNLVVVQVKDLTAPEPAHWKQINDDMLQMTAQSLLAQNVVVAKITLADITATLLQGETMTGGVYVYVGGQKTVFQGYRSADTLISFIEKVKKGAVAIIDGKVQKRAFDRVRSIKLVGYFAPASPELLIFEEAARVNHPAIPFYAIVDPIVAPHLGMNVTGTIHMHLPFEPKRPLVLPPGLITAANIQAFIDFNNAPVMREVKKENLHAVWGPGTEGTVQLVAFIRFYSPEGAYYHKLLRKMVKQGVNTTKTSILVVDPDDFTTLRDHWEQKFGLDLTKPAIGLVNFTDYSATWLDTTSVNLQGNKTDNVQALHDLLLQLEVNITGVPATQEVPLPESLNQEQQPGQNLPPSGQEPNQPVPPAQAQAVPPAGQQPPPQAAPGKQDPTRTPEL